MTPEERKTHLRRIAALGGKATSSKPGHMSMIGKRGFKSLCRKFPGNSRRYALMHLNKGGKLAARYVPAKHFPTAEDEAFFDAAVETAYDRTIHFGGSTDA